MDISISLALIIKDVEKTIERCLSDFGQIADEIVVVDTGSTDNSLDIVSKFTDNIYHFDWTDDFSAARDYSFDKCTKDWILWCDGDDYAYPEDLNKIKDLDISDKDMVIIDYVYSHDEFGNDRLIVPRERLLRRSCGFKWEGEIHEYIPLKGRTYKAPDIKTHHNKQHGTSERNLAILERVVQKNPTTRYVFYLAKEYLEFGKYDDSIHYFKEFFKKKDAYWEDIFVAHLKTALCYFHKKDEMKFKEHIFESLKIEDRWSEPYYHLGLFYMNKEQWDKAIIWFESAARVKRPKELLSSYLPEYNTWLPNLNLCVCYNAIGDFKKAYECNKEVLRYRPQDSRALNNKKVLSNALKRKNDRELRDGKGKRLNLGSGSKKIEGYINCDIFEGPGIEEIFDLDNIPYIDNTVEAIYSEHSLEHVTFKRAEEAIKEWYRVLKPGGEVTLYMPDFEKCCEAYLKAPLEGVKYMNTRAWYKMTIYGIQVSQGGEPDDAQIHRCGFSKEEIRIVMERNGFKVLSVENYGGPGQKPDYDTPSMAIKAIKAVSTLKIGWVSVENWIAAQTRIRVLKINQWLKDKGYISKIITFEEALDYDIIIIGKKFDEDTYNNIKRLKNEGKAIYCDLCENLINWAWVNEIISLCDRVICCSTALAEQVKPINSNIAVIEDAWEK